MCNSNIITTNYIYLLQEREFIKTNKINAKFLYLENIKIEV
jgi:hypothetical protein